MDNDLLLQTLRELSLEDGHDYLQQHMAELSDHASIGNLLADEALNQLYTNPAISLKLAEILMFYGEQAEHTLSHALGLKAKGDALRAIGLHQAAIDNLDIAGEEFLGIGDEGNWARSRISWIVSCAWMGDIEKGLEVADRARETFIHTNEYGWVCVLDSNVAAIYLQKGLYHEAINMYSRMVSMYSSVEGQSETFIQRAIAVAQANWGEILSWLGEFEHATTLLEHAQQQFIELKEISLIAHVEIRLADIAYTQGYFGSALYRYYQASDILKEESIDDPILLAELKLKMANCLTKLNRIQDACHLAGEATAIFKQRDISIETADALREYAHILVNARELQKAIEVLSEAETLFTQAGFERSAFNTKLQQAEIALQLRSAIDAYEYANAAKMYFDTHDLIVQSLRSCLTMANSLILSTEQVKTTIGNYTEITSAKIQEAICLCQHTVKLASQHNFQEEAYRSYYLLGKLYVLKEDLPGAGHYYDLAITIVERMLENLAFDLSPSFLHTAWTLYEDAAYLAIRQSQLEQGFNYLERARSTALRQHLNTSTTRQKLADEHEGGNVSLENGAVVLRLQQELKELQANYHQYSILLTDWETLASLSLDSTLIRREMKECETKIEELFDRLHLYEMDTLYVTQKSRQNTYSTLLLDMSKLQNNLYADQLLITYFLYQEKLIIFTMSAEQLSIYENPDGKGELERLLPLFFARLEPGAWPDPQNPPQESLRRLLKKLYDVLIAPVKAHLPPEDGHLIIVPYGMLHKFPFHALYDGSHFLIEDFQINYLPASNLLVHFNNHSSPKVGNASIPQTANSKPLILGYSGNGYLQRCIDEAQMLAKMFHDDCYLEQEATTVRFIEQASASAIIHIATHGHARLDMPNFSSVRMADGELTALDVFGLNLEHCELATLSGCETGLSLIRGGDEQLGLGRAFLAAGARSLVISLWPVEDQATIELMEIFYQRLLAGESKLQALRTAQCSFLSSDLSAYHHPYFWAAFRLVGDPGPLSAYSTSSSVLTSKAELTR